MSETSTRFASDSARPWGLAATFGFGLVVWYTFLLVQTAVSTGAERMYLFLGIYGDLPVDPHGLTFAIASCATASLCGALVIAAARLRVTLDVRDYLALRPAPPGMVRHWLLIALVIVAQIELVSYLVKGELAPAIWLEAYRSAVVVPLFWLALVVAAPAFEEMVFRGFLFAGIERSRIGVRGAVAISALSWTLVHGHEDPLDWLFTFLFAIVLGLARARTGSIRVTFAMHALNNLVATVGLAWAAGG